MKVVLFGATGMLGRGVLIEALADPGVESVLSVGRSSCGIVHPKLRELLRLDLHDYSGLDADFSGLDACFFCLGVTSAGMSEADYHRVTVDLTLAAAAALRKHSPNLTFCFISGVGTDSTEQGRTMWARVKGKAENALLRMGFKAATMFRPGFIQPVKGVHSRTASYRIFYAILRPFTPLLRLLMPGLVTTSEKLGLAMIRAARSGYPKPILGVRDINALAEAGPV